MIRSPNLWAGVAAGAVAYYLWCRRRSGARVMVSGSLTQPRPLRRQGRLLRGQGSEFRPAYWPLGGF